MDYFDEQTPITPEEQEIINGPEAGSPDQVNEAKTDGTPVKLTDTESAAYKAGRAAGAAAQIAGSVMGSVLKEAGNRIDTIMTPEGPVQVETAPAAMKSMVGGEDLSDLFEPPQEEDNDMYTDDLTEPAGDSELGVDEGDILGGDMEDLFSVDEPLTPPPGRIIVRRVHSRRQQPPPAGMAGIR